MRAIEKACFPLDAWPLLELITVLILPNLVKIKAEVDGKMVGFIGGDAHRGENVGWITTLGVLPQFQRLGIATALLDCVRNKKWACRWSSLPFENPISPPNACILSADIVSRSLGKIL